MTLNNIDTSQKREIGRDWTRSIALAGLCAGLVVVMGYGTQIEPDSYHSHRFQTGSFLALPFLVPGALWAIYRLFVPFGALVRIAPTGFVDRRVSSLEIPWSEIVNVVRRGEFISLTLSRRFSAGFRPSISQRVIKVTRKSARASHLLVASWCMARTEHPLVDIIEAYRATHSKTTAPA